MKAKFGMVVVAGSGKIGGHVASRNRGGAYFRTKVTPINPQSADQSSVRAAFTAAAKRWRDLTSTQRAAWNAAVTNFASTDIFGDIKNPSGFNLYMKLNQNLFAANGNVIDEPPLPTAVTGPTLLTAVPDASSQLFPLTFTGPTADETDTIVLATAQLSQGKSFVKNEFRQVSVIPGGGTSPLAFGAAYVAKFGALVEGTKIVLKFRFVNNLNGIASDGPEFVTTVVA